MWKDFQPRLNGVGVELGTDSSLLEVGTSSEGGRDSVVVRFQVVGQVNLSEQMEGIRELTAMNEVFEKAIEFNQFLAWISWYSSYEWFVTFGHHQLNSSYHLSPNRNS
ncbi:hypothetical protein Salat_1412300 [Sesamum alatum]|uniref:Uncharacterized protein n=1 Tax=Sesamum alatum TaxID=300844 RepID=A0AAE2CLD4_9LAMI|nr:hypothetical protein Salat_1412300 [Sesamum alatum]